MKLFLNFLLVICLACGVIAGGEGKTGTTDLSYNCGDGHYVMCDVNAKVNGGELGYEMLCNETLSTSEDGIVGYDCECDKVTPQEGRGGYNCVQCDEVTPQEGRGGYNCVQCAEATIQEGRGGYNCVQCDEVTPQEGCGGYNCVQCAESTIQEGRGGYNCVQCDEFTPKEGRGGYN
ncbi:uncharacterized protein BO97DRAFT_415605 [Aspergillus homomorphus CBS 101889]|uniref:Uncharacterized protein n=1 Tax=Aspergillus homomorphus (strain CBS 101889) TaxID=1450537 RepID=A0A395HTD9_ASPHC|nr:hypothetical protein BO97DRAFT_415605 [Aspergillus homomorphus CBS 101889]RAL10816.1 hypothetical protein BO97DRAFT_415605 [Aspergillus homomorphus CBS 101889]